MSKKVGMFLDILLMRGASIIFNPVGLESTESTCWPSMLNMTHDHFSFIRLNRLMCSQVDMFAVDTLPMEMEVSSPNVAAAQPTVPQQMAQPDLPQPAVTPGVTQPVQPLAVPPAVAPMATGEMVPAKPAAAPVAQPVQQMGVPVPVPHAVAPTQPAATAMVPVQPLQQPLAVAAAPMVPVQPLQQPLAVAAAPMVPVQPLQPAAPTANVAPKPAQPLAARPAQPSPPVVAVQPLQPAAPTANVAPEPAQPLAAQPAQPAAPVVPVQPLEPAAPTANVAPEPAQPLAVQPAQPAAPVVPVQPLEPAAPTANVAEPAQPLASVVKPLPVAQQSQEQNAQQPAATAAAKKEEEQADKDLQAMGWLTAKSCRPQASPHGTSGAVHVADGSANQADALRRQKSQVFQPPQGAPPQISPKQEFAVPRPPAKLQPQLQIPQPLAAQSSKQQLMDAEYSRRAAANLLGRLKKNPSRLNGLPSLRKMVFEEDKKNDLISMLCENGGCLEQVQVHLQQQEERGRVFSAKKKALRWTKKQMEDAYGPDADKVMKYKESVGMTEEDENCPDGLVYLIAQREDEEDDYTRSGWDVLRGSFQEEHILSAILAGMVKFHMGNETVFCRMDDFFTLRHFDEYRQSSGDPGQCG